MRSFVQVFHVGAHLYKEESLLWRKIEASHDHIRFQEYNSDQIGLFNCLLSDERDEDILKNENVGVKFKLCSQNLNFLSQEKEDEIILNQLEDLETYFEATLQLLDKKMAWFFNKMSKSRKKKAYVSIGLAQEDALEVLAHRNLSFALQHLNEKVFDADKKYIVMSAQQINQQIDLHSIYPLTKELYLYSLVGDAPPLSDINLLKQVITFFDEENTENEHLKIFENYHFSYVVLDKNEEISLYNSAFIQSKLETKMIKECRNKDLVEVEGLLYRIIVKKNNEETFLCFIPIEVLDEHSFNQRSVELGIICSSMAHELNNPLAGVQGALEVLLLDEFDESLEAQLKQMLEGVKRCKEIVGTFLGFSRRKRAILENPESILKSAQQAFSLMRFRLIESRVNLNMSYSSKDIFYAHYNPHVLIISLYLIFGEIFTSMSHDLLVDDTQSPSMELSFVESKSKVSIISKKNLSLKESFLNSKLLKHLLEELRLCLKVEAKQVSLERLNTFKDV